jgi:hypothetical protein
VARDELTAAQPKAVRLGAARPKGAPDAAAEAPAAAAAVRLPGVAAAWGEEAVLPREVVEAPAGERLPEVAAVAVAVQHAAGAEEAARPGVARDGPAVQRPAAPGVPWACRRGQLLLSPEPIPAARSAQGMPR